MFKSADFILEFKRRARLWRFIMGKLGGKPLNLLIYLNFNYFN